MFLSLSVFKDLPKSAGPGPRKNESFPEETGWSCESGCSLFAQKTLKLSQCHVHSLRPLNFVNFSILVSYFTGHVNIVCIKWMSSETWIFENRV